MKEGAHPSVIKRLFLSLVLLGLLSVFAVAGEPAAILPQSFAGWTLKGTPRITTNAAQADAAYPAVLEEYGFVESQTATYARDDGRKLTLKVAKFKDATGAYGAFTFYLQPRMRTEEIGSRAASQNDRILFFRSNILVDANFDHVTAMSGSELRDLAAMLPKATGSAGNMPSLPQYLPKKDVVANSDKYILGPQAQMAIKAPLSAQQIDFKVEPEILSQDYTSDDGPLTLTVVNYPTPQLAGQQFKSLQASAQGAAGQLLVRRSGPLLAVVTGATGSSAAKNLLNSVNYEAEVTWDQQTSVSKRDNIGNLIVAIFALIGIILLISLIFGIFFGGIRIVLGRLFPQKVFNRHDDVIQLHLK